jgi:hypothetical protein
MECIGGNCALFMTFQLMNIVVLLLTSSSSWRIARCTFLLAEISKQGSHLGEALGSSPAESQNLLIHEPSVGWYPREGSVVVCGVSPPCHEYHFVSE